MKELNRYFDFVINGLACIAGFFIVCTIFIECYEVVMRYFLHRPPIWGVEVVEYMLFLIAFLGATWALRQKSHISVTVLVERLSPRARIYCNLFACLMGIAVSVIIFWFSLTTTWNCYVTNVMVVKTTPLPKWIFLSFIVLGYLLLLLEFVRQFSGHLIELKVKDGREEMPEERG